VTYRVGIVDAATTNDLRRAVLRPQWPAGATMPGDTDDAVHVGAFDDEELVGACLVLPRPYPLHPEEQGTWQLRGMVTAPDRRGSGIGALMLRGVDDEVLRRGGRLIWCNARTSARTFYERCGYTAEGPEFLHEESRLPHFQMWREPPAPTTSSTRVGGPADA
jgi:GNAT superfamily N-acetyltransferase